LVVKNYVASSLAGRFGKQDLPLTLYNSGVWAPNTIYKAHFDCNTILDQKRHRVANEYCLNHCI